MYPLALRFERLLGDPRQRAFEVTFPETEPGSVDRKRPLGRVAYSLEAVLSIIGEPTTTSLHRVPPARSSARAGSWYRA